RCGRHTAGGTLRPEVPEARRAATERRAQQRALRQPRYLHAAQGRGAAVLCRAVAPMVGTDGNHGGTEAPTEPRSDGRNHGDTETRRHGGRADRWCVRPAGAAWPRLVEALTTEEKNGRGTVARSSPPPSRLPRGRLRGPLAGPEFSGRASSR